MQNVEKEVVALYGKLWQEIDSIRTPAIMSQFLANVALPQDWFENKVCLDVGSGSGFAVWVLQQLGATCHACDLGFDSLRRARKHLSGNGAGGLWVHASALELPYGSRAFDFVHCNGVLHHTRDPRQGFAELARVTRPGGTLFVGLYGKGGLYNAALRLGRSAASVIPYQWTEAAITPLLRGCRVPHSFMPAKISVLDNLYVPIRQRFREEEIHRWFVAAGFEDVIRTKTTIYDHQKKLNRLIHGEGYLQLRGRKATKERCSATTSL